MLTSSDIQFSLILKPIYLIYDKKSLHALNVVLYQRMSRRLTNQIGENLNEVYIFMINETNSLE